MPYAEREFICAGCGMLIVRRAARGARPRCAPCAIKHSTTCMIEIHGRRGDAYERWLLASIAALTARLDEYRRRGAYEDPLEALRKE